VSLLNSQFFLPDGRKLGFTAIGEGSPVIYFHGTASSRLEIHLIKQLTQKHLQIIGIDRPGYGLSTYQPRRALEDFNTNINALADHLGLKRFSVLGWSGGAAFTLAYLAHNQQRVTQALIVAAPNLPFDASKAHNIPLARYIMKLPFISKIAMRQLHRELLRADGNPIAFLETPQGKQLIQGATKRDLEFFQNPGWIRLLYQAMVEAFRQGEVAIKAIVEEHHLFLKQWNLPFDNIDGTKLHIWHGKDDLTCRVNNAHSIAKTVLNANLEVFQNAGHCVMFDHLEQLAQVLKT
jgi:pimeloyl-ACP methyl ester carboxylesterase